MTSENDDQIYIKVGPSGSTAELSNVQYWDDGVHPAIRYIYVCSSENSVDSIQVAYLDLSDGTVLSPKHGNTLSTEFFEEINISPNDLIISVSGSYSTENVEYNSNHQLLTSLKFVTASGKTYGPYGNNASDRKDNLFRSQKSKSFCFKTNGGVRGFHGSTNGSHLCSIGIYVQAEAPSDALDLLLSNSI